MLLRNLLLEYRRNEIFNSIGPSWWFRYCDHKMYILTSLLFFPQRSSTLGRKWFASFVVPLGGISTKSYWKKEKESVRLCWRLQVPRGQNYYYSFGRTRIYAYTLRFGCNSIERVLKASYYIHLHTHTRIYIFM